MTTVKFIDRDELIDEIYNELHTLKDLNLIDSSFLYPKIDYCLSYLKNKTITYKHTYLKITNYKADLPEDFLELRHIFYCQGYTTTIPHYNYRVEYKPIDNQKCLTPFIARHTCSTACQTPCQYGDGDFYFEQQYENFVVNAIQIRPITVKSNSQLCKQFVQSQSIETATIVNNQLVTQTIDGYLFIDYKSSITDGLIPDVPKIKEAIKNICIYELFKIIKYNGEQDAIQNYQLSKADAAIAYNILKAAASEQSISDLYAFRNHLTDRFSILTKLYDSNYLTSLKLNYGK